MDYTSNLIHAGFARDMLTCFAIGVTACGLAMDLASLRLARLRPPEPGRIVGLPLVPWMLYFLSTFFWFLRGNLTLGLIALAALTVWHAAVHRKITTKP